MKVQHFRARRLDSDPQRCQGSCPGFYTLSSQTFSDLQLTLKEVFSSGGLYDCKNNSRVHSNGDLKDL